MDGESFFHSFPRSQCLRSFDSSIKILRSILEFGLLLVPEILSYPAELRDQGDERDKIVSVQRRLSLTMLPIERLAEHCGFFGPIALEFSPLTARRLGALPVIYLPQAISEEEVALDKLGYFFSYRVAELQYICERIKKLQYDIRQHRPHSFIRVSDRNEGGEIKIDTLSLKILVEMILGPSEVGELSAALRGLSSLFYPTDECRDSIELVRSPFYYYLQREWRILSGLTLDGKAVDMPLNQTERDAILACNPRMNDLIRLRQRSVPLIDACTILREVQEQPLRMFIEAIHAPRPWRAEIESLLSEFSLSSSVKLVTAY